MKQKRDLEMKRAWDKERDREKFQIFTLVNLINKVVNQTTYAKDVYGE